MTASIASDAAYSIGSNSSAAIDLIVANPVIAVRPPTARLEFLEDAGTVAIGIVAVAVEGVSIPSSLSFFVSARPSRAPLCMVQDYENLSAMTVRFSASDFSAQDGRQIASKSVNVVLIDDDDAEGDEYFQLRVIASSLSDGVALTQYDGTLCTSICDYRVDILDDESAPAQVTGVRLTPGGGALLVAWSQVTGADGYKVQWKSGSEDFSDAATTGREAVISSGSTTSYTIPSLTDGTTYTVRVIASRGTLDGTASSDVSERPDKPTLSVTDASAKEGTPLSFTVSLSRALSSDVTVEYATSVSATNTAASDDFTAVDGETLTIAAGGSSGSITVQTVDDSNIEDDETFTLTLSNPSDNAALGATFSATGTIENNDADAATVSQIVFSSVPTSGHYRLGETVELSVTFNEAVDVTGIPRILLSMDGTPAADSYATYDAGASSGTVLVFRKVLTAADDDDSDGIDVSANALELNGGTIVVSGTSVAANLDHAALSGGQIRTRVVQDIEVSSQASVGAPAPTGIYGPGETIEFTVTFGESVTVTGTPSLTIVASDSGTQDASYTNGSGGTALVFSWTVPNDVPGEETQISVPSNVGSDDGLQLNGGSIRDSNSLEVNLRHQAFTTDAQADTTAPILLAGGAVVNGTEVVLTFERGGGLAEHLNETSVPGTSAFIVRNVNNRSTPVTNVDVTGAEVTLTLASAVGHAQAMKVNYQGSALKDLWGNSSGNFSERSLRNDSPEPQLSLADVAVDEDDGNAVFRVNVDIPSAEAATVDYATSDDTAISGSDYTDTNGTLTIPANSEFANIQVPITDDSVSEQNETFSLKLSNASNATIAVSESTATIVDNDGTPTLSIEDASAEEGEAVEFNVTLSPIASQDVTVQYDTSISDGTDTASSDDFTAATSQILTIPAGDSTATISIATVEDSTEEDDETFTVTLSNPSSNVAIDSQKTSATGTITNDDVVRAKVTNVAFVPSSGTLGLGDMIEVRARFSRAVDVAGTPRVKLYFNQNHRFHEYALYDASASSDTVLVFKRQITGGDDDDNSIRAVELQKNKGAIRNKGTTVDANINIDLTHGPAIDTRWVRGIELTSTPEVSETITGNPVFGTDETLRFKVTFKHAVEIDQTNGSPVLNFNFGGSSTSYIAAYETGSGTDELTFVWTVPASVSGDGKLLKIETNNIEHSGSINDAKGLAHGGGSIENDDGLKVNIRHAAKSFDVRTDTSAPRLRTNPDAATVDGVTLTLTFVNAAGGAEFLNENSVPAESDFSVSVDGTSRAVDSVAVDGAKVELTLASAVGHAQTVLVGYTPGTNPLKDLWDNATGNFTDRSVRNDSPEPKLSIEDVTVSEGAGTAVFTVALDIASGETATVEYATSDDTATAGLDYSATTGTLTFDPGDLSKTIDVTISEDSLGEGSETFTVTLSNATNASIDDGTASGTITDNEQTPTLSIADATAVEGNPIEFTVSLSPVAAQDVTVGYATSDGTATSDANHADGADYTAPSANATLTIVAGQGSATISVPTGDDQVYEPDETFTLTLSGPTNAVLGTAKTGTGTIENNDTASSDASLATLTVKVNGSAISLTPVFSASTYNYEASVSNTSASVTIEVTTTDSNATVAISDDDDTATPKEAVLDLAFGENTTTVTATAEDGSTQDYILVITRSLPVLGWEANQFKFINEDSGDVELEVYLRPASDEVVTVDYATLSDNGSLANEDYVHTSGTLRFEPGETEKTVVVSILDDTIYEPSNAGNVLVRLSNVSETAVFHPTNGSDIRLLTFNDNDLPPTASMEDVSVDEDAGTMTFELELSHQVEADIVYRVVSYGRRGTATQGVDYEEFLEFDKAEIEIVSRQTSASFSVNIVDDAVDEDDETITFDWRRQGSDTATSSINVTGTIVDNDSRGATVSKSSLPLTEGGSDSYEVVLTSAPTGTVTITPTVTGSTDVSVDPSVLTFTGSNWDTAQTVTVSAEHDTDALDETATISHSVAGADYGANSVTAASVAVTVDDDETPPVLDLTLDAITGDDTVNIAEKGAGFTIAGDTGTESGVDVSVTIGTESPLTTTSADGGNGTATWSVAIPANAAYITGTSVTVTVAATKTGFTDPADVARTLAIDLVAPTAPTYTVPTSLTVGAAITAMNPSGGADIDTYSVAGLPSGLAIDDGTGVITGTPDAADTNTASVTVTVADTAGNTATVNLPFPIVAKGTQTLTGFRYSAAAMTFDTPPPTVTVPTGAQTSLSYAADPPEVCSVDQASGALTILGIGQCEITVTAATSADWNEATASFTVEVQAAGNLVLNVAPIAGNDTVNIAEHEAGFTITGDTGTEMGVDVSVTIGSESPLTTTSTDDGNGTGVWSVAVPANAAYITGTSVTVTVAATKTGFTDPANVTRTLAIDLVAPTAPTYTEPTSLTVGAAITAMNPSGGADIVAYSVEGLPSGLAIDGTSGAITGTPDTADATPTTATVTVADTADNTVTVVINFPAVAKGTQTLTGFEYSAASMTFGSTVPTVTVPTGAQTSLSYAADPPEVCTVNVTTGELTILDDGDCVITVTAAASDDWNEATASFTVEVQAAGNLVLNVADIGADNTVNIAEHEVGFTIGGDTGTESGVDVSVTIGSASPLTATSADDGNDTATWSVAVPANATYITGTSVTVTVAATKTGFTDPANVTRTLAIDLTAPTAPTYTEPTSLTVGALIVAMSPTGGTDIDTYSVEGLPSGLAIDDTSGAITGTPDTADANPTTATVTVADTAGNTATVVINFPAVAKGTQTLAGFEYSAASMTFGSTVPTVTAPTGAETPLSYTADPPEVCTVNATTGELTILDAGNCVITATAAASDDWNEATATFTVAVQAGGNLVLNLDDIAADDTVNIAEKAAGFDITGDTGAESGVDVSVTIGSASPLTATSTDDGNDTATWSVAVPANAVYLTGTNITVTVAATKTGFTDATEVTRTLAIDLTAPTAPTYTVPTSLTVGAAITAMNPTGGADIAAYSVEALPSGLAIDDATGAITGTPDTADANPTTATVTVADTADNPATVDLTFPAVAKGTQTLTGFQYSVGSATLGSTPPTVTAPSGAQTALSYAADPPTVCSVNQTSGVLTILGAGDCVITVTAVGTGDWNQATATFTVVVQSEGNLVLNVDAITGDDTVNIAEKGAGFTIAGDTGTESGVDVSVTIGTESPLTTTSADGGNGTATWSVAIPANAAYITGTSVTVTVAATKTGFTDPADVARTLAIDLVAPTAPTYTVPTSLTVGAAITAMNPSGGADIDTYSVAGLPSGLAIDDGTGVITGTPDAADTNTASVTVTVADTAGNTATVNLPFPIVAKGTQTLTGFRYSAAAMTFDTPPPTVTVPTGAQTSLSYAADPPEVCSVDQASGALTILGIGQCEITVTAATSADWNEATASFTVEVQAAGNLVLNVAPIAGNDTVNIAEHEAGFTITGDTGTEMGVDVSVTIGSESPLTTTSTDDGNGTGVWSVAVPANAAYITGTSVTVTVAATKTGFTDPANVTRTLAIDLVAPTAPTYTEPTSLTVGAAITAMNPSGGADIVAYSVEGLPSGLAIDGTSGAITGTPDTADATPTTATVTVADTADNTVTVVINFPAVAKGTQTLTGFEYSAASMTFGSTVPTVTVPTGAQTSLSYAADPPEVCTVNVTTGELTILDDGDCVITVTAAASDDWNEATASFTVEVQAAGNLVLNVADIGADNTVNIAEHEVGFTIGGDTGTESGVDVSVTIGSASPLTATSADDGNDTATWSVAVPANATYITGTSVTVTVAATKTGFTDPANVTRTLAIDLTAPTAPTYTEPTSLTVGALIVAMSPTGGTDIDTYSVEGLPSGLAIDDTSGAITGTPDTADANPTTATVTVADTAGNTATVVINFPAVAKGTQTLAGFEYSAASMTFGSTVPTVTAPTGAETPLSYTADPPEVCTVNATTGELTILDAGNCVITATAAASDDWNEATATFTVAVQAGGNLVLNLDDIAADDTVNIAEKAAGFDITGDTGAESGVDVSVTIGSASPLTATSTDDGNDTATWSVAVPANAVYLTGTNITVTVAATKTGFTDATEVTRTLAIDLTAPTAPTYTVPTSLTVGAAITAMNPTGGADIAAYSVEALPSGLAIDDATGAITGTPDTADANPTTATVTVADTADNPATVDLTFPAVAKGTQTLTGFQYSVGSATLGSTPPTVTAPSGAQTALSYAADPPTVCSVNQTSGALTLVAIGQCVITVTAEGTDDYEEATATFSVLIESSGPRSTSIALVVEPTTVDESASATVVTVTANLNANPQALGIVVNIAVGASADDATEGTDYVAIGDLTLTIESGQTSGNTTFTLTPIDDEHVEVDELVTVSGSTTTSGISVSQSTIAIVDDDINRSVAIDPVELTVPEGGSEGYTVVLTSQPSGTVNVSSTGTNGTDLSLNQSTLVFSTTNWDQPQSVIVSAAQDEDAEDDVVSISHTVTGADYGANDVTAADVVVTVDDDDSISTGVVLSLSRRSIGESDGATSIVLTGSLNGVTRTETTTIAVTVGQSNDTATEGSDYAAVDDFDLTIAAGQTSGSVSFEFTPNADFIDETEESISIVGTSEIVGFDVASSTLAIADDDERGVIVSLAELTVPESLSSTYTMVLTSQPTGDVTVTPTVSGDTNVTVNPSSLTFTPASWNSALSVTVSANEDADSDDSTATIEHTIMGADYSSVAVADVVVSVSDNDTSSSSILLSVDADLIGEDAGAKEVRVSTKLDRASRASDTNVTVSIGAAADAAVAGRDYVTVDNFVVTIPSGSTETEATFTFEPIDDSLIEPHENLSIWGTTDAAEFSVIGTSITIRDDDSSNDRPEFARDLARVIEVVENTVSGVAIGAPIEASDADGHTLTYSLTGPDATNFTIDSSSGQLRTLATLDYEANARRWLTISADDGHGGQADFPMNVIVLDVDEQPGRVTAPSVRAASDSTNRLDLRWDTPDENGGPAIIGYTVQYREGNSASWIHHQHVGTHTRATVSGLVASTTYQARVRALNGEIVGEWSELGTGNTGSAANAAPVFSSDLQTLVRVPENTIPGTELGAPFRATDSDDDALTFLLEGPDRSDFELDKETGQIRSRSQFDFESKANYVLTVRADDGKGGSARIAVTVQITDIDERPGVPGAPLVIAASGSTTSVEVIWRTPARNGGPDLTGYELEYRTSGDGETESSSWIAYRHTGLSTRTIIRWLNPATSYDVRVRAQNGEIPGVWSELGTGGTGVSVNTPPEFDASVVTKLTVDENTPGGIELGERFSATDTDNDTLTWLLDGAAASAFSIDPENGQLSSSALLDHETKPYRSVIVRVSDGNGGTDAVRVKVVVADVEEPAPTVIAPRVLATADSTTSLDLRWDEPVTNGGPAIVGYEVQYRIGNSGNWVDHAYDGMNTRSSIANLEEASDYQIRVRALNGEIPGDWSEPGSGRTGASSNTVPVFEAGLTRTLTVSENVVPDTELGSPFSATDSDNDALTWLLDGGDAHGFAIDPDRGQLRTRAMLDHESRPIWSFSILVSDGKGGVDTLAVSVNVADEAEQATRPAPPWVLSSTDSATSLDIRWNASNPAGGPAISGYVVQYRADAAAAWIEHDVEYTTSQAELASVSTTIPDLEADSVYHVRVRALNGETPSEWSAMSIGNTARPENVAPTFIDASATRSVSEDAELGDPVGAPVSATDVDRDRLTYFLGGTDAGAYRIDHDTGQIRVNTALDFETKASYFLTVTANDGAGGTDTNDVMIELVDVQETSAVVGPSTPTGVTLNRRLSLNQLNELHAELTLRWNKPVSTTGTAESIAWVEFRFGRYPVSSNGITLPAFKCADNRLFESDGWWRIPDSGVKGANARAYRFDASALGCHVLRDTFELRAQVRAVALTDDGSSTITSTPSTEARMRDEAPRIAGVWLDSATVDDLGTGDDLEFSVAFTEPVRVTTSSGSPTLEFRLGDQTKIAVFRTAEDPPVFRNYGSGHIGSRLRFQYSIQEADDLTGGIVVPANAIGLAGGASIVDATGPNRYTANLRNETTTISEGTTVVATTEQASILAQFDEDSIPVDHDGDTEFTVQIEFDDASAASEDSGSIDLPDLTLTEASFLITAGRVTDLSRLVEGENHRWSLRVEPSSMSDVSISLGPTINCSDTGAVCTSDGRKLTNNIHAVVKGPPSFSVADARTIEAPDATIDFVVSLNRKLDDTVSVDYATVDGTALAGEDYTATSGSLTFEAGETSKTVVVSVLDDAHDDDGETLTLKLSNPSGGNTYLGDDTAMGVIENADPMPKAWIARFGRTISNHVVDAIQGRFRGERWTSQFTFGSTQDSDSHHGRYHVSSAIGSRGFSHEGDRWGVNPSFDTSVINSGAFPDRLGRVQNDSYSEAVLYDRGSQRLVRPGPRQLLIGNGFVWTNEGEQEGDADDCAECPLWSTWGKVAATRFDGNDDSMSLDGEVTTAMLGVDATWNGWLKGIVLAHSEAHGGYSHETATGGLINSRMSSLHPFIQYRVSDRTSAWATVGYGDGDLSLTPAVTLKSMDTDLRMSTAAFGGRSVLSMRTSKFGSYELAIRSDAMMTRTESGGTVNMAGAVGATSRARFVIDGSGALSVGSSGLFTPSLEIGIRYDDGDAETGAGIEVNGGLGYSIGRLTAELGTRTLVVHEDGDYKEWGYSTMVRYASDDDGRGLRLSLGTVRGAALSSVHSLWSSNDVSRWVRDSALKQASQRFHGEVGFGLQTPNGRMNWVPYVSIDSDGTAAGAFNVGVLLTSRTGLDVTMELGRRHSERANTESAFRLDGSLRW